MKKAVTIKQNYEFRRLYRRGQSAVGYGLVVYCRRNSLGHNRLGITVSTKLGNAVVRNRARRRLREIHRLNGDKLSQGWDIILVARSKAVTAPFDDLMRSYLKLCRKVGLVREDSV